MQEDRDYSCGGASKSPVEASKENRCWQRSIFIVFSFLMLMICLSPLPARATPEMDALAHAFDTLKWVAYSPTHYNPNRNIQPSEHDVRADLELLKRHGFQGIVTYGCSGSLATYVPKVANELGMKVIVGVWNPKDLKAGSEVQNAANLAANNAAVLAVTIGNEGLHDKYNMWNPDHMNYTLDQVRTAIATVRAKTTKPITSSQQWKSYTEADFRNVCDFMFPTIHPYWEGVYNAKSGADFTVSHIQTIKNVSGNKIVIPKEVGYPTDGNKHNCTEQTQKDYYDDLAKSPCKFVYFEAFNQPWKNERTNGTEPHWGMFKADRSPKLMMK